jgi:hypothetical protein
MGVDGSKIWDSRDGFRAVSRGIFMMWLVEYASWALVDVMD